MDGWQTEVTGDRTLIVTHPDGHKWWFYFPLGWKGGDVPRHKATAWKHDQPPPDPFANNYAATEAVERAKAEGWV